MATIVTENDGSERIDDMPTVPEWAIQGFFKNILTMVLLDPSENVRLIKKMKFRFSSQFLINVQTSNPLSWCHCKKGRNFPYC
jgi:hypothetical protein